MPLYVPSPFLSQAFPYGDRKLTNRSSLGRHTQAGAVSTQGKKKELLLLSSKYFWKNGKS